MLLDNNQISPNNSQSYPEVFQRHKKRGRKNKITPDILKKLEEVFALGGTDEEACFYADISEQTLYNYQSRNPEFIERKQRLKFRPVLKARRTIIEWLDSPNYAKWYLERKIKEETIEFKKPQNEENNRSLSELIQNASPEVRNEVINALRKLFEENRKSDEKITLPPNENTL
ncbi:MAG TPA: hypothetical protein PLY37_02685 [Candidatus Pacearchaeota archaeon]|nr:hypothetical protein [Candidatus Pacearchaeota archaeon]